ncbi:phytochrome A [Striga asiatica]|uniref:Phytochrome A n=1 Tax=Striga asiatica TaxID=4170 RepID=A0A5A7QFY0_STRAF|nr:phytochrome A [Striga asiatica]
MVFLHKKGICSIALISRELLTDSSPANAPRGRLSLRLLGFLAGASCREEMKGPLGAAGEGWRGVVAGAAYSYSDRRPAMRRSAGGSACGHSNRRIFARDLLRRGGCVAEARWRHGGSTPAGEDDGEKCAECV